MNLSKVFFISSIISIYSIFGQFSDTPKDQIEVYIFLHESCLISQYYTLPLRELHEAYAAPNLHFIGLFPSKHSTVEKISAFKEKYNIPFELRADHHHYLTESLGATITPEVIVYNKTKEHILYQGRIDDTFVRVGKKKRLATTSELADVLDAITNDTEIIIPNKEAIGCFIAKSNY